ncbi:MAG: hypothetical protein H6963_01715 [Chromatiaceae bacterium]|nr:hypothetical protein [Chromatiaceae bacterium]MCP5407997.1 hypothetical protein [Chromatiaceae bacterium]MCP5442896.1 hypothetical protein [Chromatiaceae bacterium]
MSHLEQRLNNDLENIRAKVAAQAVLVETALRNAVQAFQTGNHTLAHTTVLNDHPINRNMRAIDRLCHSFIAVHLPSAGHLRLISAVIRVNIELERIGDYAVTIAREAIQLTSPPTGEIGRELERLSGETFMMLKQSIKAFNELNPEIARSTMLIADQMEHNLDMVYAQMMSSDQHHVVKDTFATFVVFTQLKRSADQAKNLCEETVFAATGDQKAPKVYKILFVDESNSVASQMAEAIARNNYPKSALYTSAGKNPAADINPGLRQFLEMRLARFEGSTTSIAQISPNKLADQTLVVSLQGPVSDYFPKLPFHTAALEWNIPNIGSAPLEDNDMESLYREIALRISDLMNIMHGEEAS